MKEYYIVAAQAGTEGRRNLSTSRLSPPETKAQRVKKVTTGAA